MKIMTKASELGIKAMVALSRDDNPVANKNLAKEIGCSIAHLSKVLQSLRRRGLIVSVRGPHGGYKIDGVAAMTAAQVVEAVDGNGFRRGPGRKPSKDLYKVMISQIERAVSETLDMYDISHLALS